MNTRLSQTRETESHLERRAAFAYRYAYGRSTESRLAGDNGQDYLTLREDTSCLIFALCDGVGQSFFGDLAAREVGEALVDWLWQRSPADDDAQSLRLALTRRLNVLAPQVDAQVQAISLPVDLSPLVREVLEQKRHTGSHSTFVAGRLDMATDRLTLVWLGDSVLRFWGQDGSERTPELGGAFLTESRWSSQSGIVGELNVFLSPLHGVARVLAYSDGLSSAADTLSASPSNYQLDEVISDLATSPTSDDISLLEIWLGSVPEEDQPRLPPPLNVQLAYRDGQLMLNWSPVAGARHYQVEVSNGGARRWQVEHPPHTIEVEASKAVGAAARIRGWDDRGPGEWSAAVPLLVEMPIQEPVVPDMDVTQQAAVIPAPADRRWWVWAALAVAAVMFVVCLAGVALALRGGAVRQRLQPTMTSPGQVFDVTLTVPMANTPVIPPSATAAPTTTPWLTWTPAPMPSPSSTQVLTPTMTLAPPPTTTPSPTVTATETVIPSPAVQDTSTPTVTPSPPIQTEVPLDTPSPDPGDLSPKPEGGSLESRWIGPGVGHFATGLPQLFSRISPTASLRRLSAWDEGGVENQPSQGSQALQKSATGLSVYVVEEVADSRGLIVLRHSECSRSEVVPSFVL